MPERQKEEKNAQQSNKTRAYEFAYLNQYAQCFIQNNFEKCIFFKINLIIDPPLQSWRIRDKKI